MVMKLMAVLHRLAVGVIDGWLFKKALTAGVGLQESGPWTLAPLHFIFVVPW